MSNSKNFSILKWIIFPLLVAAFGAGIVYVSITVFGLSGSVPTILLVLICLAISLIFVLHTSNHAVKPAMIAAFAFECLGVCALGVTLVCSIVVLREFSGASQTLASETATELEQSKEKTNQIKALGAIKSSKAQSKIADSITKSEDSAKRSGVTLSSIYDKAEKLLFWPLVGESSVYLIGLMVVFGLVQFLGSGVQHEVGQTLQPPQAQRPQQRLQFLAANAPFRASSNLHSTSNGNGFSLSLVQASGGVAIRFLERGLQTAHVLRVTAKVAEDNQLDSMDYETLARWSLKALEEAGKQSKPVYERIKNSL